MYRRVILELRRSLAGRAAIVRVAQAATVLAWRRYWASRAHVRRGDAECSRRTVLSLMSDQSYHVLATVFSEGFSPLVNRKDGTVQGRRKKASSPSAIGPAPLQDLISHSATIPADVAPGTNDPDVAQKTASTPHCSTSAQRLPRCKLYARANDDMDQKSLLSRNAR